MDKKARRELIAKRIAKEFKDGDIVNLGIGMPTLVGNFVPDDVEIILQSENGFVGLGPAPAPGEEDPDLTNAGGQPVTIKPGGAFFDSAMSFSIIRGGHVDATVLGALEVDEKGNLANWMIPGKMVPGMGGAMDLVTGAKKVIIAMEHTAKDGSPKILKECTLPLTGREVVDLIVTDMGVMEVTDKGIVLKEIAPGLTVEDVQKATEAKLIIDENLKEMEV
ncbi:Butyrate--acetoacetate CoA-transferase subunit B [Koleobacter methoxysyntrophicus]|jgi:acetate CoA/acetoacetate CoA-transferase beta subunit|uniref:Probable succinyl-CoA:3-ketoacid coenzyme A transferase subunit B n=1 Tax=Koleobacter methoxysyntrophicus TaxID=2751313 RepID=A0A8A0RNG3_9FIRM|nr:CoA transferase subunit B [Koleobacter methoxysyntrophicus]QSQ09059.1 Butyrate--acetoacetate CoA-transferase subunit B [Koleobacter methoxysyntrophicus]